MSSAFLLGMQEVEEAKEARVPIMAPSPPRRRLMELSPRSKRSRAKALWIRRRRGSVCGEGNLFTASSPEQPASPSPSDQLGKPINAIPGSLEWIRQVDQFIFRELARKDQQKPPKHSAKDRKMRILMSMR